MSEIFVKRPDGAIVAIDSADAQRAANSGYTVVDQSELRVAQAEADPAAAGGLAAGTYSAPQAFAEKALSSATFGQFPGLDSPDAVAGGRRFADEHPVAAFGAEVLGQLPAALATGAAGTALRGAAAGAGVAARAGAFAGDVALNAAVGGAQVEGEESRLSGENFSWTDAAVAGLAGETLGRGAAWGVSRAVGGARNLMARGERDLVAQDASASLAKGGWLSDYRVAQHAEKYHNELAELAAKDLDVLEESFAEVSRQDRKRARIVRTVVDAPEAQAAVRVEAAEGLRGLRGALQDELADAPGPAKRLLKQLDDRVAALDDAPSGKKLWRVLDENRQALQEYRQDLYQAYESNPGAAWLSRDGLAAIDAAEKATREALLREDVWGEAAARMQREYNVPFHEKYFPTSKTIRGQLMFSPAKNAEGFPTYRGEPDRIRRFFSRGADDVDGHRLAEQFRDYLDGVEAIARTGQQDTPQAAHRVLEAARRLRKAQANAAFVTEAAARAARRSGVAEVGLDVAAGVAGASAFGPVGGVAFAGAARGLRVGHWLSKAAQRLGLGSGAAVDVARLLERDALPAPLGRDAALVDDVLDSVPSRPPPGPPSGAPPPAPPSGPGGLTPSMRAEALDPNWTPSGAPPRGGRATLADDLGPEPSAAGEVTRRADPMDDRGVAQAVENDRLNTGSVDRARETRRLKALTEGEFRDVVGRLKNTGQPEARELAEELEARAHELVDEGLVAPRSDRPSLNDVDEFYRRRPWSEETAPPAPTASLEDLLADGPLSRRELIERGVTRDQMNAAVRDGRLFEEGPRLHLADDPTGAVAGLKSAGLEIGMGRARVAETMEHVFGEGRAPSPEQWRQIAPLELLNQIAPGGTARVDILGDSFIWSAHGPSTKTGPHRSIDGIEDPGGYQDQTWSISRTFSRDDAGKLEVHHDHFMIRGDLQGSGAGAKALKSMMEVYRKIGVDVVTVDSIEVGKYFWPSIGFNNPDPRIIRKAVDSYANWLVEAKGLSTLEAEAAVKSIRSLPSLAQAEFGKDFLLEVSGPWNFGLRLDLKDESPMYHLMRGRLDIAAAAVAGLGSMWEGERKEGEEPPAAAGAAVAGAALFGRRAGLFKSARTKLVADVAKRLFSATAEPAARVAGRLLYNRAELKARQEEFSTWQANPQELVDRVAEGFRDVPPEHSGSVASGVFAAATFLKSRLPSVTELNAVSLRQIPVSNEAMAKYARYEQAALRPREALQDASAGGHITTELMETLGELYPDLLAELRVGAIQTVRENGPPTTVQAKLSYARLFDGRGELADPALSQTVANMTAYAYEQAVPTKPGGGPTSSGNVSHVAAANAAPAWGA